MIRARTAYRSVWNRARIGTLRHAVQARIILVARLIELELCSNRNCDIRFTGIIGKHFYFAALKLIQYSAQTDRITRA